MAYLPFGADPRSCIGMRLTLLEMKMMLATLFREYTILPGEHLESKFKFRDRTTITPEEVCIQLMKRNT